MRYASLPLGAFGQWAVLNNCELHGVSLESQILTPDGVDKGGGLKATTDHPAHNVLLSVPPDMVLTKEGVDLCAKTDRHLRELLQAMETFIQTPRGSIMLFLLYQLTIASPDNTGSGVGVNSPWTDYVKFLPKVIPLPTFYTPEEQELLVGTSLADALGHKLSSLDEEFASLREATSQVDWCRKVWWHEDGDRLMFQDWKLADALYRSRALELPQNVGVGMCPFLDMANHASGDLYNTRFDVGSDGQAVLITRDDKSLAKDEEVMIRYGVGGACEMIFSYGFLDYQVASAREMFLDLRIPSDDPLRFAKLKHNQEAPGVRVYVDDKNTLRWESGFIWWACINEEDGLDFRVTQTVEGERELSATWKGVEFAPAQLRSVLMEDELRDLFLLRAVVMIQERLETQGTQLAGSEIRFNAAAANVGVSRNIWEMIGQLRDLELELMETAYESLETEKQELLKSPIVVEYFAHQAPADDDAVDTEDFS